ncbi:MAG: hypothetical protein JRC86_04330 [Deltaproteobacteria bacterium]|nr:hypothetical protein [Deltaproteobacteria bacterium]
MPITYTVHNKGRFVHAIASGMVADDDLVDYETAFANDDRITLSSDVVFEIKPDSIVTITDNGVLKAIKHKKNPAKKAKSYRFAIVTSGIDGQIWDMAQFYKIMMNKLKFPGVIALVFLSLRVAKKWLGIEDNSVCI